MAPVGVLPATGGPTKDFGGRITSSVVVTCVVAASSGLIFGYDIGISGGVTTMEPFLKKFFPSVLRQAGAAETNIYCQYDSQLLTAFTSSLYIAGLVASLVASRVTAALGRKNTMVLGGLTFFAGGAINGGAVNVAMLILGRILLGLGVGFTNQAAPLYLSEVAPAKWRGAFNTGFQFFIGIGVVASNFLNFFLSKHPWGWRLSLGLAVVPAAIMTQVTGINIIAFYAPVLFQSIGFGKDSALISSTILGVVNLGAILVSTAVVDRYGRRFLFVAGGLQMLVCKLAVAAVLVAGTGASGTEHISKELAVAVLILLCTYGAGFGWSWGPLSWLIPSEIFPIKIRTTGQGISQAVNFATTFALSQSFLAMLCHLKYGAFLFYAGWIATMTLFVMLFLPETKGIPLDSMQGIWEQHWYWRRFVSTTVSA
ncbi:unnamed protein product [Linum tenue]|uniref:Major facilitator superfamily (MFS) profile domain-containing protein n=1 Tax=Linum tenue TaxID=586396 RepID=A0AAV0M842_9ROSI|nr:unnamed protein product [Linum tenue]